MLTRRKLGRKSQPDKGTKIYRNLLIYKILFFDIVIDLWRFGVPESEGCNENNLKRVAG